MKKYLLKIDKFLDRHTALWLLLALLLILRIPNFSEPYWYGDEAIYLTIGHSLRQGRQLYTEIIDHKTPLIYYLASVPNQFYFRILLTGWMIVSTALFYSLSRKFFKNKYLTWISSLLFVIFTTVPWLEGHIPNGELFVIGWVLAGMWCLSQTNYFQQLFAKKVNINTTDIQNKLWLITGGGFLGLGILTKVPAITDLAAVLLAPWFVSWLQIIKNKKASIAVIKEKLIKIWQQWRLILVGTIGVIALSVLYFMAINSGQDYLQFGLLYNLHYTQTWQLSLPSPWLEFCFSLPGKTLILAVAVMILSITKKVSLKFKFFLGWSLLALYAASLSNRPYPHYLLQAVPPLALFITTVIEDVWHMLKAKKGWLKISSHLLTTLAIFAFFAAIILTLNFRPYSTKKYYVNFLKFASGGLTQQEYYQTFNKLTADNYPLAQFLKQNNVQELFIWGTNSMLYALSETVPVGRYTVAFHIEDMNAHQETLQAVADANPRFIVVMNDAPDFPQLYQYLDQYYTANPNYNYLTLYKKK